MTPLYIKTESAKLDYFSATDQHQKSSLSKHFHDLKNQQTQLEARRATLEAEYCKSVHIPKLWSLSSSDSAFVNCFVTAPHEIVQF